jgi:hypothetical protein
MESHSSVLPAPDNLFLNIKLSNGAIFKVKVLFVAFHFQDGWGSTETYGYFKDGKLEWTVLKEDITISIE